LFVTRYPQRVRSYSDSGTASGVELPVSGDVTETVDSRSYGSENCVDTSNQITYTVSI